MKLLRTGILGCFAVACASADITTAPTPPASTLIVFENVSVRTMSDDEILPDRRVVVDGERIVSIDPMTSAAAHPGATRVDGTGKVLMPGLADMHVHYFSTDAGPLFLSNGVTTVRNPWGSTQSITLDARNKSGADIGPHIYSSGPLMDGPEPIWGEGSVKITSAEEIVGAIEAQRSAGFKAIKLYEGITPEIFKVGVETAKEKGLQVWTHTPMGMTYRDVVALKVDSIEHFNDAEDHLIAPGDDLPTGPGSYFRTWANADKSQIVDLAEEVAAAGVWNAPTFTVIAKRYEYGAEADSFFASAPAQFVGPGLSGWWRGSASRMGEYTEVKQAAAYNQLAFAKALYDAGAPLLIGSDTPNPFVVAGFSIHDEIAAFAEAGIPAIDILRIATADAARFLGEEDTFGVIKPGARADLILLEGDPGLELSVLKNPAGVMMNGRWYDRAALTAMRAEISAKVVEQTEEAAEADGVTDGETGD